MAEVIQDLNNKDDISEKNSDSTIEISSNVTSDGKNAKIIKCQYCPSTILVPESATLVTNNFVLPNIKKSKGKKQETNEPSNKYWCVNDMYQFENVGFSNTVDGMKYLICADCEVGPIGWHDLETKLSYVSFNRIKYC